MKLHIPDPCPVKWNSMTPSGDGRFCSSCEKVVVDFSKMNEKEIKAYFAHHPIEQTCGSFYRYQLSDQRTGRLEGVVLSWRQRAEQQIKNKAARIVAVFAMGTLLTLMGCYRRHGGCPAYLKNNQAPVSTAPKSHRI